MSKPTYYMGLDLGQLAAFSAAAVVERHAAKAPGRRPRHVVSYLRRWPLGTSYPTIVADVGQLLDTPHRASGERLLRGCVLAVDRTGVGQAVLDLLKDARLPAKLVPVLITGGRVVTPEGGGYHVPKLELCGVLQALVQSGRLEVARVPQAELLRKEMENFQVKITPAGNEQFGAWREGQNDDLVLAVAMAAWRAEREPDGRGFKPYVLGGEQPRPVLPHTALCSGLKYWK